MRTVKVLGLALVAMFALSAMGAASASALLFLTKETKELFTVNSVNHPKLVTTGGNTIECESTLAHGFALNKTDLADEVIFTFHKCTGLSEPCNSSGQPSGLIQTKPLMGLLVTIPTTKKFGIALHPESGTELAAFECASGLVAVKVTGSVAGEFTEAKNNEEFSETTVSFKQSGGKQEIQSYETLEGKVTGLHLESAITGAIKETGESAEEASGKIILAHPNGKLCGNL